MGFFKGLLNFIIMLVLSVCLMTWLSYGLLESSILSVEENNNMLVNTNFTEEVTDEMLDKYHTSLDELRFDKDVLLEFVNEAGTGVLGYVFSETETMPNVDVGFLKDFVVDAIATEGLGKIEGNVNIDEMIQALREVPEGNSISSAVKSYTKTLDLDIDQSEIDKVTELYLENKELENEELSKLIIGGIANEVLNLDEMNTELSLQELFDKLMAKNPFTIVRNVMKVVDKDLQGYLPLMMILLILMILVIEFRVGSAAIWLALSLLVVIVPLQALRLADFFIQKDLIEIINGMESYKEYMMDVLISRLNVYSIVIGIIIVVLFILSAVFRRQVDNRIENAEQKKRSRFVLVRVAIFAILAFGLYLNGNAARNYNLELYDELNALQPSDFDPQSIDLTLRELLNVNFDF